MTNRILLVAACALCAAALNADFTGKVSGNVHGGGAYLGDVRITAEFDPTWGFSDEDQRKSFVEHNGPFPRITATGETTSDADGSFELLVTVKTGGEGELPTTHMGGSYPDPLNAAYVAVKLTFVKEGYRTLSQSHRAIDVADEDRWEPRYIKRVNANMIGKRTLRTRIIRLSDRSPVADARVAVRIHPDRPRPGAPIPPPYTFAEARTDKDGVLRLSDEQCPLGGFQFMLLADGLAFARGSRAWQPFPTTMGENDLGDLVVTPGGWLDFRFEEEVKGGFVRLNAPQHGRIHWQYTEHVGAEARIGPLPEGEYDLTVHPSAGYWGTRAEFRINGGENTNLGEIKLERNLEVAIEPHGAGMIARFQVKLEQLSGYIPETIRMEMRGRTNRPWVVRRSLTTEHNVVGGLARGRWKATVEAEGVPPAVVEFDLPRDEPLTVDFNQSGKLKVEFDGQVDRHIFREEPVLYAVEADSPVWESIRGLSTLEVIEYLRRCDESGVFTNDPARGPERSIPSGKENEIAPVPAGRYTVFSSRGYRSLEAIDVKKGEIKTVTLKSGPANVTVRVVNRGEPMPGELVYLQVNPGRRGQGAATHNARTDKRGVAVFEGIRGGATCRLMPAWEFEWRRKTGKTFAHSWEEPEPGTIHVAHNDRIEHELDVFDPERAWVSVAVNAPADVKLTEARLYDLDGDELGTMIGKDVTYADGRFDFGLQKPGSYEFVLSVPNKLGCPMTRLLRVEPGPPRPFEFDLELGDVEVKVSPGAGFKDRRVQVTLTPGHELAWKGSRYIGVNKGLNEGDRFVFESIPHGRYRVTASSFTQDYRGLFRYRSKNIEIDGSVFVELEIEEDVGDLKLTFEDVPRSWRSQSGDAMYIELLDGDKPAWQGDPRPVARCGVSVTIHSVKEGTYTLRVRTHGFHTYVQENVKITSGRTKQLKIKLREWPELRVKLTRPDPPDGRHHGRSRMRITDVEYLDEAGEAIPSGSTSRESSRFKWEQPDPSDTSKVQLVFKYIPDHCRRIRFSLAGFKPVTVDVQRNDGETTEIEVELEAE